MPGDSRDFIGLNRAGRPNNAIFVSFTDPTVPAECLEAAKVTWRRICMKDCDKQAEEQLKKVCPVPNLSDCKCHLLISTGTWEGDLPAVFTAPQTL